MTSERILKIHIKRSHTREQGVSVVPMARQSQSFRVVANTGLLHKPLSDPLVTFAPAVAQTLPFTVHPPKNVIIERRGDSYYIPKIIKKPSVPLAVDQQISTCSKSLNDKGKVI